MSRFDLAQRVWECVSLHVIILDDRGELGQIWVNSPSLPPLFVNVRRTSLFGIKALFGVTPDLATFAKAIAGGFPLSMLAGRKDVMGMPTRTQQVTDDPLRI